LRCLRGGKLASVNAASNKVEVACWVVLPVVLINGFDAVGKQQNRNGANDFSFLLVLIGIVYSGD
jgi:hypothetical protein